MSTATKDNAIAATNDAAIALKTILHARTFPNSTAQAKEDAAVDAGISAMVAAFGAIDYSVPAPAMPGGTPSAPKVYSGQSGLIISGLSFDGTGKAVDLLTLNSCTNVHITMCRFSNTNGISIRLNNCTNITVDYNFFTMVNFGVMATNCIGTKVNFNQGLNLWAPVKYNNNFAHFVQYINCSGSGQQINDNIFFSQRGIAVHPHDCISIFQTSGASGSPIQIKRNKIKGGQTDGGWPNTGDTGVGITAPDVSGNHYDITDNVVVNCGVNGIIVVATADTINVANNIAICDDKTMKSYDGFTFTGTKTNMTVSGNRARWIRPDGSYLGLWLGKSGATTQAGVTFTNNNWNDATLTSTIIPDNIITYK